MNLFLKRVFFGAISLLFIVGGIYKQGKGQFRHVSRAGGVLQLSGMREGGAS